MDFIKDRQDLMANYFLDERQFIDELIEVSKLNEDALTNNAYASRMNIDNYPTHKIKNPETGEYEEYCAASKHWSKVDPYCTDRKSIHYAGEDRVYLILKNKYTQEWEFPVTRIMMSETFLNAKLKLFKEISGDIWKVKFFGQGPQMATIREFTPVEKTDKRNTDLRGVRSYFFGAHHWRGYPELFTTNEETDYNDWAWVPKKQLNEYMTEQYYNVFINMCRTR